MIINSVCVCGSGIEAARIAVASAAAGHFTLLFHLDPLELDRVDDWIRAQMHDLVPENLHYTSDLQLCLADLFIEAIAGNAEEKRDLFNQLAELNHSECIFASSEQPGPIDEMAAAVMQPGRVTGYRFDEALLESIPAAGTDPQTREAMQVFMNSLRSGA